MSVRAANLDFSDLSIRVGPAWHTHCSSVKRLNLSSEVLKGDAMRWDELHRDWRAMSSLLLTHWDKLTDEELCRIEGRRDEMVHLLRQRYGYSQEEADRAIEKFEEQVQLPGRID